MFRMSTIVFFIIMINTSLLSDNFTIEKIDEFSVTSNRSRIMKKNIVIDNPHLYTLTDYGLEIYSINNDGELILLSRTPIIDGNTIEKVDNFIFIGTRKKRFNPFNTKIYKLDVSNPHHPQTMTSLEFDDDVQSIDNIIDINGHLLIDMSRFPQFSYPLLDYDLEVVTDSVPIATILRAKIGESLILTETAAGYNIYDLSDLENIALVGTGDISAVHLSAVFYYNTHRDSVLILGNQREISFWDISDMNNWELLQYLYIDEQDYINYSVRSFVFENYLLYLNTNNLIVIDLDDYSFYQFLDMEFFSGSLGSSAAFRNDNIYITTNRRGIQRFHYDEGVFSYIETIADYFSNMTAYINSNYLFSGSGFSDSEIVVFNVADPYQVEELCRIDLGSLGSFFFTHNELLIFQRVIDFEYESYLEIIDVSDPFNTYTRDVIDLGGWLYSDAYVLIDETEPDALYVVLYYEMRLLKFDISEPGEHELLFEFELPFRYVFSCTVDNGFLYHISTNGTSDVNDLRIYSGLNNNNPVLVNTLSNIGEYSLPPNSEITNGFLSVFMWVELPGSTEEYHYNTLFYDLSEPTDPELAFEINMSGRPIVIDDIVFHSPGSIVHVFDVSGNPSGVLTPFNFFINHGFAHQMIPQQIGEEKYLYCVSLSNIGVYEYSYELNTDDDIIELPAVTSLSQNYPNPFNPETKIDFFLEKGGEVKLEVFNIRGQRLSVLIDAELEEGEHSYIWHPKTMAGKDLPSGVYLYRLQSDNYEKTRKMLYLK